jgi:hypothetical protein
MSVASEHMAEPRPRYLPYASGSFRMSMGLQALDPVTWMQPDARYAEELREKHRLLTERHAEVFQATPGSVPAQREVLDRLLDHLAADHPGLVEVDGDEVRVTATGAAYRRADFATAPLDLAGRLVQEDLCLMAPPGEPGAGEGKPGEGENGYRLVAASLCFPARWSLAEKFDKPMIRIHERVPGYAETLGRPVDRFFSHLADGRPVWRLNWSVIDDPALFQPTGSGKFRTGTDDAITPETAGERLWLRVERQTLLRLPESRHILFGIRTYVDPLSALATRPDMATALAGAIRDLPDGLRRYKSIGRFEEAVLGWLDGVG